MVYSIARVVCRFVFTILRNWEVNGQENLPASGGVVIVSNHTSLWDSVIVGACFNRQISYMAKEELYNQNIFFTWLIKQLGTFPVKRGSSDRAAIKFALSYLESGNIIALFPEGTRSKSGDLQEARNGAALLAIKAGVPVLPVGIIGARGWGKVTVKVGKPIPTVDYAGSRVNKELLQEFSARFMEQIACLTATEAK